MAAPIDESGSARRGSTLEGECCEIARWLLVCCIALGGLMADAQPARAEPPAAEPVVRDRPDDVPHGQLRFRVLGSSEGLHNLVVISIAEDRDGFLWLGTEDGVYRFDGDRFTRYSVADGLASSVAHVVGVAPDGRVCAGGNNGLACWDGMRFSRDRTDGVPATSIQSLASYGGKLWVGTDAGLYVQGDGDSFAPAPGWPGGAASASAMWADRDGLVVGDGATVDLLGPDGIWHQLAGIGLGDDVVEGVLRDRAGALWIRTASHMWFVPRGAARAVDLHEGLPTGFDATGAPTAMAIGVRGEVLIGTDDGITYRDGDHWRTIGRSSGMPAATTRALLLDRHGNLWIGSTGLFELRYGGLIEHFDVASGLPGEVVWTYRRDRAGTLWAGTNRCLARAVAGHWSCLPGTDGRVVRAIVFAPQGGMFVGGQPSELLYIDPDGRTTPIGGTDRPDRTIYALALGPEGDLWVATKLGLYRLPGAVPGPLIPVAIPGLRDTARFGSLVAVGDRLWTTAAPGGLAVLDHGTWRVVTRSDGLRSASASYLIARSDGRLCTAYSEPYGVTCFRYDGHRAVDLVHIGTSDGLTTGMVYFLGEDAAHRLWIGTGDGVNVLTDPPAGSATGDSNGVATGGSMEHFLESDGLAGNDSASQAFLLDRDSSVWLGSTGGASHVLAQYYAGPPELPRSVLLGGQLGDRPIAVAAQPVEAARDRSALSVEFATGSMLDAQRVEYQVRLWPLETEWSANHRQRQAHYPGLLPGSYRFEVRAHVDAGAWGPITALELSVRAAWWQTRWFVGLLAAATLAGVAAAFTWRQRSVLRRRTRQLREQAEAGFRAVIDVMPDLISMQRDGKVVYTNRALRRLVDADRGRRSLELDLMDLVHPDDRAQVIDLFRRIGQLEPGVASEMLEIRLRGAEGGWRTCEVSGIRVEIAGAITVVSSGRDVTERARLRANLMMTDRMVSLGTLAAGIAHEINNPLAYVTGNLEAMAETLAAGEHEPRTEPRDPRVPRDERAELSAQVHDARDGAERVRKIVHGLRSFSRQEEETRVALAVTDVLEAAIRLTGNELRHRAQLVRDFAPVPLVFADDGRLTQVFINLLVNAAQAITDGRSSENRIAVRTRTDEQGRAAIEIADTGTGIPPDVLSRVFDPFFTTKPLGEGTGLGLSICHGIVTGLGGQISIESAVGNGTIVRIALPPAAVVPPPVAALASSQADPQPSGRRERVMLVDDEPLVAQTMERLLRRDYDVTVARHGREAIDWIASGLRFDAIISDVMMPNMTGIEFVEELQQVAPDQARRLIFLSGGAFTPHTRDQLERFGAPQLEKPVTASELRACVRRIVRERGAA